MEKIKQITLLIILLIGQVVYSQLPGDKVKNPFTAVDGHTYRVGEVIKITNPSKGEVYQTVILYKFVNTLNKVSNFLGALEGKRPPRTEFDFATRKVKDFSGEIMYFKKWKSNMYAVVDYGNDYHLAVALNLALQSREMASNNPDYTDKLLENTTADFTDNTTRVKSFSSNFDVRLLSAEGNIEKQTVTLDFLVSHKIVHQKVCLRSYRSDTRLFDFNGNEYNSRLVGIGSDFYDYVCAKIPTNVPIKMTVIFNRILPTVKEFSYADVGVYYGDYDSFASVNGSIEVNNIKVDWK